MSAEYEADRYMPAGYLVHVEIPAQTVFLYVHAKDEKEARTKGRLGWGYPNQLKVTEVLEIIEREDQLAKYVALIPTPTDRPEQVTLSREDADTIRDCCNYTRENVHWAWVKWDHGPAVERLEQALAALSTPQQDGAE